MAFMQLIPRESLAAAVNRTFAQPSLRRFPGGESFRSHRDDGLNGHAYSRFVRQIDRCVQMDRIADDYSRCGLRHTTPPRSYLAFILPARTRTSHQTWYTPSRNG